MSNKERLNKAYKILMEQTPVDYVLDTYTAPDFIEFVGSAGGDAVTYRVYNDGTIYER